MGNSYFVFLYTIYIFELKQKHRGLSLGVGILYYSFPCSVGKAIIYPFSPCKGR